MRESHSADATAGLCGMAHTPPDLIVIDGGQGQVNIAKQVIQEELGLDIPIAGLQKNDKHQTHELLFGDPLQVIELSRTSQEFSSCNGSKMKSTVSPSPSTASYGPRIPSPLSWMASKVWDQNASSCWWSTSSHWPRSRKLLWMRSSRSVSHEQSRRQCKKKWMENKISRLKKI